MLYRLAPLRPPGLTDKTSDLRCEAATDMHGQPCTLLPCALSTQSFPEHFRQAATYPTRDQHRYSDEMQLHFTKDENPLSSSLIHVKHCKALFHASKAPFLDELDVA